MAFLYAVFVVIGVGILWVWRAFRHKPDRERRRIHFLLIILLAVYGYWGWRLRGSPEETVHFVQYGVLSALLFAACRYRMPDPLVHLGVVLLGTVLGTVDEIIQWVTPRRVFGFRDVFINGGSVAIVQAFLFLGPRPMAGQSISPTSIRRVGYLGLVVLAVFWGCLANTPPRVRWYTERFPRLRFLRHTYSSMTEYGYRHVEPDLRAAFFSRFTRDQLRAQDSSRAQEVAGRVRLVAEEGRYDEFLRAWTPVTDPFAHEMGVRIYRRNAHLRQARASRSPREAQAHATIALREERILQRYFGRALEASGLNLQPATLQRLAAAEDPTEFYVSPVSHNLIVRVSEKQVHLFMLCSMVLTVALTRRYGKRRVTS